MQLFMLCIHLQKFAKPSRARNGCKNANIIVASNGDIDEGWLQVIIVMK
jgi:hypothetical protein